MTVRVWLTNCGNEEVWEETIPDEDSSFEQFCADVLASGYYTSNETSAVWFPPQVIRMIDIKAE